MITSIIFIAGIGFCISLYAFVLEKKVKSDQKYKPVCDISDTISCSKAILSDYGNMFGISNALLGMFFYAGLMILAYLDMRFFVFIAAVGACIYSVYLAYILYFKIQSLCVICTSLYGINILLLIISYVSL